MKNSKKYSPKVKELFRSLKERYSAVEQFKSEDPIEMVIMASLNEYIPFEECQKALNKMKSHFVDFNDLRVARKEEIIEQLGSKVGDKTGRKIAASLSDKLNAIFSTYDCLNIDELFELGKREVRKKMEKMWGEDFFVGSFCLLTIFDGHAVPMNSIMLEYMRNEKLVNPQADDSEICGFLERLISAKDAYRFYTVVRLASEEYVSVKREVSKVSGKKSSKKKTSRKSTKKKTAKKTKKKTAKKTSKKVSTKASKKTARKKTAAKSKKKTKKKAKSKTKTKKKTKKKTSKKTRKTASKTKSKKK